MAAYRYFRLTPSGQAGASGNLSFSGSSEINLRSVAGVENTNYPTATGYAVERDPQQAADGITTGGNGWLYNTFNAPNGVQESILFDFGPGTTVDVVEYAVGPYPTSSNKANRSWGGWTLEGTNDDPAGTPTWNVIDQQSGITWDGTEALQAFSVGAAPRTGTAALNAPQGILFGVAAGEGGSGALTAPAATVSGLGAVFAQASGIVVDADALNYADDAIITADTVDTDLADVGADIRINQSGSWGSGTTNRYFSRSGDAGGGLIAKTKTGSFDMEVSGWSRRGALFARLTPGGDAIYLYHNGEVGDGEIIVGLTNSITDANGNPDVSDRFVTISGLNVPGYDRADTQGDEFTLGVSGFQVYVLYNGVEIWRDKNVGWRHYVQGRAAWYGHNSTTYGHRTMKAEHLTDATLFSDVGSKVYDIRDLGAKALQTTGDMAQGSNDLTVADPTGFEVGDPIIVEIGGEAGGGQVGELDGVGGYWPGQQVALISDLPATDQGEFYVQEDQRVYEYKNGYQPEPKYYRHTAVPISLLATITAINGNVLTLDTPAANATTGAGVYFDNLRTYLVTDAFDNRYNSVAGPLTFVIPEGDFWFSNNFKYYSHDFGTLRGEGKYLSHFKTPMGCLSTGVDVTSPDSTFRDFSVHGSKRDVGHHPEDDSTHIGVTLAAGSSRSVVQDMRFIDVPRAVNASYADNCWAYRCESIFTDGLNGYVQWMFLWSDGDGGGTVDCTTVSPRPNPSFECFKQANGTHIRPSGINAMFSNNSAGGTHYQRPYTRFRTGADINNAVISRPVTGNDWWDQFPDNPVLNFNDNVGSTAFLNMGGLIEDFVFVFEGYLDEREAFAKGIAVGPAAWNNVRVIGGVYWIPPALRGTPEDEENAVTVGGNSGSNHLIQNVRSYGSQNGQHPGADLVFQYGALGVMDNNVSETTSPGTNGTVTNHTTLTDYLANLGPTSPPTPVIDAQAALGDRTFNFSAWDSVDPQGYITHYEWDFGDGTTSDLPFQSHQFATPGLKTVTLTVTNEYGDQASTTQQVNATGGQAGIVGTGDLTAPAGSLTASGLVGSTTVTNGTASLNAPVGGLYGPVAPGVGVEEGLTLTTSIPPKTEWLANAAARTATNVWAGEILFPSPEPSGGAVIFEVGGTVIGAAVHVRDESFVRLQFGNGSQTDVPPSAQLATGTSHIDFPKDVLPWDGQMHTVAWEFNHATKKIRFWIDGELIASSDNIPAGGAGYVGNPSQVFGTDEGQWLSQSFGSAPSGMTPSPWYDDAGASNLRFYQDQESNWQLASSGPVTGTVGGVPTRTGTLTAAQGAANLSASGAVQVTGSLAVSGPSAAFSGVGATAQPGGSLSLSAPRGFFQTAGAVQITGQSTLQPQAAVFTSTGSVACVGDMAVVGPQASLTGTAQAIVGATSTLTGPAANLFATLESVTRGTSALVGGQYQVSGAGVVLTTGQGSLVHASASVQGAGANRVQGSTDLTASAGDLGAASGTVTISGTTSIQSPQARFSASGNPETFGTANLTAANGTLSATGQITTHALVSLGHPIATLSGTGGVILTGSTSLTAPASTLVGSAGSVTGGTAVLVAQAGTISGQGDIGLGVSVVSISAPRGVLSPIVGNTIVGGALNVSSPAGGLSTNGTILLTGSLSLLHKGRVSGSGRVFLGLPKLGLSALSKGRAALNVQRGNGRLFIP